MPPRRVRNQIRFAVVFGAAVLANASARAVDSTGGAFTTSGVAIPICRIGNAETAAKQLRGVGTPPGLCGRATNGAVAAVIDATSKADCTVGNGTVVTVCQYDSAQAGANKWVATIGSGSGDQVSVNGSSQADPSFNTSAEIAFAANANQVTASVVEIVLGTKTSGPYVAGATSNGGLTLTGSEAGTLGLLACSNGQVLKHNGSAWACATDAGGNSFATISATSGTNPVASSPTDTLAVIAGLGITVTGSSGAKSITIDATLGTTVGPTEMQSTDFGPFTCNGTTCPLDDGAVTDPKIGSGVDALKIGGGTVNNTEFSRLDGVTSAIQAQLDAMVEKVGDTMSGILNMGSNKITNLAAGTDPGDAVRFDQILAANTVVLRDGSQAFTGGQSMGGFPLTSVGSSAAGTTGAARMVDLANPCLGKAAGTCAVLSDANADGNWRDDWRSALNSLLYLNGNPRSIATAPTVELWAPPGGTYTLTASAGQDSDMVRICHSATGPANGSAALMDCSGSSATDQLPEVRFAGDWSAVLWDCVYPAGSISATGFTTRSCFRFGDVAADGYNASGVVRLNMPQPLRVKVSNSNSDATFTRFSTLLGLTCDGCAGSAGIQPTAGTLASWQQIAPGRWTGAGAMQRGLDFTLDIRDTAFASVGMKPVFYGDLLNVRVHGFVAVDTLLGRYDDSNGQSVNGDCILGSAWASNTCRGLSFERDFVWDVAGQSPDLTGSDLRFSGFSAAGVFLDTRSDCAENFLGANVFDGRAVCNAAAAYCVRNTNGANCDVPNPGVFAGYAEQQATDDPSRNSPLLALKGKTVLAPGLGWKGSSGTIQWLSTCHTATGLVEAAYGGAKDFDFRLDAYTGPPGAGVCIKTDGTGTAACGSASTKVYPGMRGYVAWARGVNASSSAINAAHNCQVDVLINGSIPAESYSGCSATQRYVSWGGSVAYINSEAADPLRAAGESVVLPLIDRLAPTDFIEVRVKDPVGSTGCANGSSCTCPSVDALRVTVNVFPDPAGE